MDGIPALWDLMMIEVFHSEPMDQRESYGDYPIAAGAQSLQRNESNRRQPDGVRVENIPRNHNVGPPPADSKSNERSKL